MSDYATPPEIQNAEATPLAHRFDASYPEAAPVPSDTHFEPEAEAPAEPGPETVVAAGSALAVAALESQAAPESQQAADDSEDEADSPQPAADLQPDDEPAPLPEPPEIPAEEGLPLAEDAAADDHPGALAGASPGDSEIVLALLEAEAAAEFDVQEALPSAEMLDFEETPAAEEDSPPPEGEALPAPELAAQPPDPPEMDALPSAEPEEDTPAIPEFVRLEPPEPEDAEEAEEALAAEPEADPGTSLAEVAAAGAVAGIAGTAAVAAATAATAASAATASPPEPPAQPASPALADPAAAPTNEPAEPPVGPHFRTDVCPRCGQPDFSKGTVLSYGRDFRPTYYKPAGLSWRRLRSLLRPFRHLVEVEAQVCRHCGLVSLQVDTDALRDIEEKYGG